jgi:hypothetical protein
MLACEAGVHHEHDLEPEEDDSIDTPSNNILTLNLTKLHHLLKDPLGSVSP